MNDLSGQNSLNRYKYNIALTPFLHLVFRNYFVQIFILRCQQDLFFFLSSISDTVNRNKFGIVIIYHESKPSEMDGMRSSA